MPQSQVLFELLPIIVDRTDAPIFSSEVCFVSGPRLRHRDFRTDGRQRFSSSALSNDLKRGGTSVASLCMGIFSEFATNDLAMSAGALLACVPVRLAAQANCDSESRNIAIANNVPGLVSCQG